MAGHKKWSIVKRLTGVLDQKRGKLLSRQANEIIVAAKTGHRDAEGHPRLRSAILAAGAASMQREAETPRKSSVQSDRKQFIYFSEAQVIVIGEGIAAQVLRRSDALIDNDHLREVHFKMHPKFDTAE